jgi:hypothetical protein
MTRQRQTACPITITYTRSDYNDLGPDPSVGMTCGDLCQRHADPGCKRGLIPPSERDKQASKPHSVIPHSDMLKGLAQKMVNINVSPAKVLSQNSYLVTGMSHPTPFHSPHLQLTRDPSRQIKNHRTLLRRPQRLLQARSRHHQSLCPQRSQTRNLPQRVQE